MTLAGFSQRGFTNKYFKLFLPFFLSESHFLGNLALNLPFLLYIFFASGTLRHAPNIRPPNIFGRKWPKSAFSVFGRKTFITETIWPKCCDDANRNRDLHVLVWSNMSAVWTDFSISENVYCTWSALKRPLLGCGNKAACTRNDSGRDGCGEPAWRRCSAQRRRRRSERRKKDLSLCTRWGAHVVWYVQWNPARKCLK